MNPHFCESEISWNQLFIADICDRWNQLCLVERIVWKAEQCCLCQRFNVSYALKWVESNRFGCRCTQVTRSPYPQCKRIASKHVKWWWHARYICIYIYILESIFWEQSFFDTGFPDSVLAHPKKPWYLAVTGTCPGDGSAIFFCLGVSRQALTSKLVVQ